MSYGTDRDQEYLNRLKTRSRTCINFQRQSERGSHNNLSSPRRLGIAIAARQRKMARWSAFVYDAIWLNC
jgi:hypothetical protein